MTDYLVVMMNSYEACKSYEDRERIIEIAKALLCDDEMQVLYDFARDIRECYWRDKNMKEIKIDAVTLRFNHAENFKKIKEHMEMCAKEEKTNEEVALALLCVAMTHYKFL